MRDLCLEETETTKSCRVSQTNTQRRDAINLTGLLRVTSKLSLVPDLLKRGRAKDVTTSSMHRKSRIQFF